MVIKTLAKSIREYKWQSLLAPFFMICEVVMEVFIPSFMGKLITDMDNGEGLDTLAINGAILLVLSALALIFGILSARAAATAGCGFAKNLRQDMFYRVQEFSFREIDKFSSASLVTRMTTDVTNVQMSYQMMTRMAVRTPLMMIMAFVMAYFTNPTISYIFLGVLPVFAVVLFLIMWKVLPFFRRIFKKYDALNNSVQENVAGMRVVKSYVREDYEKQKFGKASEDVRNDFTKAEKIMAATNPLMIMFANVIMLLIAYFCAVMISDHVDGMDVGALQSLMNYAMQILMSVMMLSMVLVMITMSAESAKRIAEVINEEPSIVNGENPITEIENGDIVYDNVSFKYSPTAEKYALSDINLEIKSGETVGIIGGTGSSKTTLIQLLSRLYDTTEGSVKVAGRDVREYDLKALRDSVAVVLQKNVLFKGTVKENLKWGNKEASDEEIERACRIAQAHEFVSQMPKGYDSMIERGGTNVSGGQKQRLCIARALLKNPKIIIFDDSTSAVDTKTDALIRQGLSEDLPNTTKIIIAQRVSSVQDADKIIVMDKGKIVEQGTHDELVALGGIYADIHNSQIKGKADDDCATEHNVKESD